MKLPKIEDFIKTIKNVVETKRVKKVDDGRGELEQKLEEINQKYENSPYRTYGEYKVANVKLKENNPISDEQIHQIATEKVGSEFDKKRNLIESEGKDTQTRLEDSKITAKNNAEQSISNLTDAVKGAKDNIESQAIKRGLGRSSIVANQLGEIEKQKIESEGDIYTTLNKTLGDIDEKIVNLKDQITSALDDLDSEKAIKINDMINELKIERQKAEDEITAYNNSVINDRIKSENEITSKGVLTGEKYSQEYAEMIADKVRSLYAYYRTFGEKTGDKITADKDFIQSQIGAGGYNLLRDRLRV